MDLGRRRSILIGLPHHGYEPGGRRFESCWAASSLLRGSCAQPFVGKHRGSRARREWFRVPLGPPNGFKRIFRHCPHVLKVPGWRLGVGVTQECSGRAVRRRGTQPGRILGRSASPSRCSAFTGRGRTGFLCSLCKSCRPAQSRAACRPRPARGRERCSPSACRPD